MTPANVKKFKDLGKKLNSLAKENPDSATGLFVILTTISALAQIATDLHFRSEANDNS